MSVLFLATPVLANGNRQDGQKLFSVCRNCHGSGQNTRENSTPVPRLGGQHSEYIVAALNAFQHGTRPHAVSLSESGRLSDQQIQDIASYVGGFEIEKFSVPSSGKTSDIQQKVEVCRSCHGERGNSSAPHYPRLAGQNRDYLLKALREYRNGIRKNPAMVYVMESLSDDEITEMAEYYSSQPNGLVWID